MLGQLGGSELAPIAAIAALLFAVAVYPTSVILRRVGLSPWLAILAVVPVINIGLLWFVAFTDWPARSRART